MGQISGPQKIHVIDFEDSFTWNIAAGFYRQGHPIVMHAHHKLNAISAGSIVVLGPGPGHPHQYTKNVKEVLERKDLYLIGVCLGHQILCNFHGFSIDKLSNPIHGFPVLSTPLQLGGDKEETSGYFQRYNSLFVLPKEIPESSDSIKVTVENNQVTWAKGKNWYSTQFHPESVGTSCPHRFFSWPSRLRYNDSQWQVTSG